MNQQTNPLSQFYRKEAIHVKLPSRGNFYGEDIIELDSNGEVGILPMTAQDEILLKSPDALLTGKAITDVIESCVPAVKKPRKLLSCDIDTLMISIRKASYGDEADMELACPNCNEMNKFSLDLDIILNQAETLDSSYEVILPDGLTVFILPGTYETLLKQYKAAFENVKAQRAIANTASDDAALNMLSQAFRELTKLNFELLHTAIDRIVFTDEEGAEQTVSEKKHIVEFIKNVDKRAVDLIDEKIAEVNKIGINRTYKAVCRHCEHEWDALIEFNPVNFS